MRASNWKQIASWRAEPRPSPDLGSPRNLHHSHPNDCEAFLQTIAIYTLSIMSSGPKQRLQALNEQMAVKPADPKAVEDLPSIPQVAPDSVGPYISPHPKKKPHTSHTNTRSKAASATK